MKKILLTGLLTLISFSIFSCSTDDIVQELPKNCDCGIVLTTEIKPYYQEQQPNGVAIWTTIKSDCGEYVHYKRVYPMGMGQDESPYHINEHYCKDEFDIRIN